MYVETAMKIWSSPVSPYFDQMNVCKRTLNTINQLKYLLINTYTWSFILLFISCINRSRISQSIGINLFDSFQDR